MLWRSTVAKPAATSSARNEEGAGLQETGSCFQQPAEQTSVCKDRADSNTVLFFCKALGNMGSLIPSVWATLLFQTQGYFVSN